MLCHPFSSITIQIRRSQYSWARDSKSKFQSKSSPRCKGPKTLDEFEWQNNEFAWKNDEFDPCIRNSLSDRDEFQWQLLTNLNDEFFNLIDKKRMWMTVWRNWTLDFNAVSFSGRNWIENLWNLMQRWRKWAGKAIKKKNIYIPLFYNQLSPTPKKISRLSYSACNVTSSY